MEKYEEIQPRTYYGLGKKLKYNEVKLEVREEIDGCESCYFDLKIQMYRILYGITVGYLFLL